MRWLIRWTAQAANDIDSLDAAVQDRVMSAIDRFVIEGMGDVRRLSGIEPPEYRLRVGKWRVRFILDHDEKAMIILHVLRRDEAY